jgi:16S rRNA G966 N2-methylase RsmD
MNDIFLTYPGGKNGSGTYQKIINLMPPHHQYVEPFLGSGAIMRAKRPAMINIGIDVNPAVIMEWKRNMPAGIPNLTVLHADALSWLHFNGRYLDKECLVYCDPPYLMSTRSSQRQIYAFELAEKEEHKRLLYILKKLKCMVILSGYWSPLYAKMLDRWRTYHFQSVTRAGTMATEWVWMNYPEPVELHDYRYLGETFRERERIKRKKVRWIQRLSKMAVLERRAMMMALEEIASKHTIPGDVAGAIDTHVDIVDRDVGRPDMAINADSIDEISHRQK